MHRSKSETRNEPRIKVRQVINKGKPIKNIEFRIKYKLLNKINIKNMLDKKLKIQEIVNCKS